MAFVVSEPIASGIVDLHCSFGLIRMELFAKETPLTCRNFIQLALEGYYDNCLFDRVIPNFIAQTANKGESIYDENEFKDEFNDRLHFNRRGLVGMVNMNKPNTNSTQFFFTLADTPELNHVNTLFARIVNNTLFNLLSLNDIELQPNSQTPLYPISINSITVVDNPFPDIVPRITAKERKQQLLDNKISKNLRAQQRKSQHVKATKNAALLSFDDEPGETIDPALAKTKFKSSHDALDDPRLSKESKDDRGTSSTLPDAISISLASASTASGKRKADSEAPGIEKKTRTEATLSKAPEPSKLEAARLEKSKLLDPSEKRRAEIAKVQADLKSAQEPTASSSALVSSSGKPIKKAKRTGPSLLQLEREKYANKAKGSGGSGSKSYDSKGKVVKREEPGLMEQLEGFRSKVLASLPEDEPTEGEEGADESAVVGAEILAKEGFFSVAGDIDEDDTNWLNHTLKFRKDATLDRHSIDEYSTHDPLAKNALSLDELKVKSDREKAGERRYAGEKGSAPNGSGGRDAGRGGGGRDQGRNAGRDDRDRGGRRDDRGRDESFASGAAGRSQAGSWKNDRLQGA